MLSAANTNTLRTSSLDSGAISKDTIIIKINNIVKKIHDNNNLHRCCGLLEVLPYLVMFLNKCIMCSLVAHSTVHLFYDGVSLVVSAG